MSTIVLKLINTDSEFIEAVSNRIHIQDEDMV